MLESYGSWVVPSKEIFEDEKGKYKWVTKYKEVPCNCHPETCCHELDDGKVLTTTKEKEYLTV